MPITNVFLRQLFVFRVLKRMVTYRELAKASRCAATVYSDDADVLGQGGLSKIETHVY